MAFSATFNKCISEGKQKYPDKTTDLSQVTDKHYDIQAFWFIY
jgi:hypothetical protein